MQSHVEAIITQGALQIETKSHNIRLAFIFILMGIILFCLLENSVHSHFLSFLVL